MKKIQPIIILAVLVLFTLAGCKGMLDKKPLTKENDQEFFKKANNMKTFAWGFYTHFFPGYSTGFGEGKFFAYDDMANPKINDTYGYPSPPLFAKHAPTSSSAWSGGYAWIYKANVFIKRIKNSEVDEKAKKKWLGVARFFRAMEYNRMVRTFGDVPYYGHVVREDHEQKLYEKRTPRTQVADSMLADFQYAVENVPVDVGNPGLQVNKDVILAFMSRVFLFQGTYLKYHDELNYDNREAEAKKFLEASKKAAKDLISSGRYSVSDDYQSLFSSLDLSGNPGIILYRHYSSGSESHSMVAYSTYEPQYSINKSGLDSYLCNDGLPIGVSPEYQGDKSVDDLFAHRDPRMKQTLDDSLRLDGAPKTTDADHGYSTTGIAQHKFVNKELIGTHDGRAPYNTTDAPVMRYGEVLLNYAEATAVLAEMGEGSFTNADLDMSINKLRDRPNVDMPHLQVTGDQPMVNGQTYDDPDRDSDVSPIIWEIRRERRVELMMEGFRQYDLKRWKKLNYADYYGNADLNKGAWINLKDWPDKVGDQLTLTNGNKGYIVPAPNKTSWRRVKKRDYLSPLPTDQIDLYEKHDVTLKQNAGW
jgi:hypothetical protein